MARPAPSVPSSATIAWARTALGCRGVDEVSELRVGSTAVHLLRVSLHDGGQAPFVLRRFVDAPRLRTDPWYVPQHEVAALELLGAAPLPVPRLVAADVDAAECDVPALLTTYLPGIGGDGLREPPGEQMLTQLVDPLSVIHAVHARDGGLPPYEPYYATEDLRIPSWSVMPSVWERVVDILTTGNAPAPGSCFIHRDYHPGNTLWVDHRLTGIIDWTTACLGPRGIDLARMRQNLAWLHGPGSANDFLDVYARETGREDRHPWWDLVDVADMLMDMPAPADAGEAARLRGWERYVAGVASEL